MRPEAASIRVVLFVAAVLSPIRPALAGAPAPQVVEPPEGGIVSSEVSISGEQARLRIDLTDGRTLVLSLADGRALVDGREVGTFQRGDALDVSWRALLRAVIDSPADDLPVVLSTWPAPAGTAGEALAAALAGIGPAAAAPPASDPDASADTIGRLEARIEALQRMVRELETTAAAATRPAPSRVTTVSVRTRQFSHIRNGFAGVVSMLMTYIVLLGIGITVVFFGRRYLEAVADTVRHATIRSGLVGLAGSFLLLPAFIVGIIALAVSIVGIPFILLWLPLFPLAAMIAAIFGYLAVAHAAGEALAERRLHGADWVKANSYYFVATGLALLLAAFVGAHIAQMGRPFLAFLHGLLITIGMLVTWVAITLGFGAVLLSRAGTRPVKPEIGPEPEPELDFAFEEGSRV